MILPGVPFEAIEQSHLRGLVDARVREQRRVEFKQKLPGTADADKQEFRCDATSFANAAGGDLVFGIREEEGAAAEVTPIEGDVDAAMLRLDGMLRTGIEPRLPGVRMRPVAIAEGWVVILRIPASWTGPHAVASRSQGAYRFYSRTSAGKHPLDVSEIRSSFLGGGSVAQRARDWQAARLGRIVARETPIVLRDAPTLVVHVVPVAAQEDVDPERVVESGVFCPFWLESDGTRWNIDGLLAYALDAERLGFGHAQLFRDGRFEATNAMLLAAPPPGRGPDAVNGLAVEHALVKGIANPLRSLEIAGAQPPFSILVSAVGVRGKGLVNPYVFPMPVAAPIDRDILILPDVVCEGYDWDRGRGMRPIIDAFWQASGASGSPSYEPGGDWKPLN
jgi:hypothetical protein